MAELDLDAAADVAEMLAPPAGAAPRVVVAAPLAPIHAGLAFQPAPHADATDLASLLGSLGPVALPPQLPAPWVAYLAVAGDLLQAAMDDVAAEAARQAAADMALAAVARALEATPRAVHWTHAGHTGEGAGACGDAGCCHACGPGPGHSVGGLLRLPALRAGRRGARRARLVNRPRDAAGRGVARAGEVWTRRVGGGFGVGV